MKGLFGRAPTLNLAQGVGSRVDIVVELPKPSTTSLVHFCDRAAPSFAPIFGETETVWLSSSSKRGGVGAGAVLNRPGASSCIPSHTFHGVFIY